MSHPTPCSDWLVASLFLSAVAWGATTGGTAALDLLVMALLLFAAIAMIPPTRLDVREAVVVLPVVGLVFGIGVAHDGLSLASARMPILGSTAFVAFAVGTASTRRARELIRIGIIFVGTLHASLAIATTGGERTGFDAPPPFHGAIGLAESPNTLAALLIATGVLTYKQFYGEESSPGDTTQVCCRPTGLVLLIVQAAGVLSTGSRFGIMMLVGLLLLASFQRDSQRWKAPTIGAAAAVIAAIGVSLIVGPAARPSLGVNALQRIGASPVFGHGGAEHIINTPTSEVPATIHAHNEILQLAIDFGVPATAVICVAGALLYVRRSGPKDPLLSLSTATILLSGMVDVTLRSTPVLVVAAFAAGAATKSPVRDPQIQLEVVPTAERDQGRSANRATHS